MPGISAAQDSQSEALSRCNEDIHRAVPCVRPGCGELGYLEVETKWIRSGRCCDITPQQGSWVQTHSQRRCEDATASSTTSSMCGYFH